MMDAIKMVIFGVIIVALISIFTGPSPAKEPKVYDPPVSVDFFAMQDKSKCIVFTVGDSHNVPQAITAICRMGPCPSEPKGLYDKEFKKHSSSPLHDLSEGDHTAELSSVYRAVYWGGPPNRPQVRGVQ